MENITIPQLMYIPRWRWIVTAFCFFVLFHLLPIFLLSDISIGFMRLMFWSGPLFLLFILTCISVYLSYRAVSFIFYEPAIAAVLYILTLHLLFPTYLAVPVYLQNLFFFIECSIVGFVFTLGGAGIGYWFRTKRSEKS